MPPTRERTAEHAPADDAASGEAGRAAEPGLGRGGQLLLACAAGVAVASVYFAQPVLPAVSADLGLAPAATGVVVGAAQVGYLLGLIAVVPLGDLLRRHRVAVVQLLVLAAALGAVALARQRLLFLAAMAVVGIAASVVQVLVAYAAIVAAPGQRGRLVGTVTGGVVTGILASRAVAGLLAEHFGWRWVYAAAAAACLLLAPLLLWRLPADPVAGAKPPYRRLLASVVSMTATDRVFRTRALLATCCFAAFGTLWSSLALLLTDAPWRLTPAQIGTFGVVGLIGVFGAAGAGRWADAGLSHRVSLVSLVLLAVSWAATVFATHSLLALLAGIVVLDFAVQAVHVSNQHVIVSAAPHASGRIIGSYMTYYSLGSATGAVTAGAMYAAAGWIGVCLLGAAFSLLALLIYTVSVQRRTHAYGR